MLNLLSLSFNEFEVQKSKNEKGLKIVDGLRKSSSLIKPQLLTHDLSHT